MYIKEFGGYVKRFEPHTHSHFSNLRLLDCINKPKDIAKRAEEIGLSGFAITDHECLCGAPIFKKLEKEIQKRNPDFKIALGNEIYLTDDRSLNQKYYHFILIAKNKQGFRALRELSSHSWMQSYYDRGMERVPTTKQELIDIVRKYPDSLIATSACLGGELATKVTEMKREKESDNKEEMLSAYQELDAFMKLMQELFHDDFYVECAPAKSKDQMYFNTSIKSIADYYGFKMIIGTDAHYLSPDKAFAHEAFLNSKGGEREVMSFYKYAYMQSEEEIIENLDGTGLDYSEMVLNSSEVYDKIENYSIEHSQVIPRVKVHDYPKNTIDYWKIDKTLYPCLHSLFLSDDAQERYWVNEVFIGLQEKGCLGKEYIDQCEVEAKVIKHIGEQLNDCLYCYFNTFKHYIDLFWECGSIVCPGRGSCTGFITCYALKITQVNPIQHDLYYWRFLNMDRVELPDIDIDLASSAKSLIIQKIKEERGRNVESDFEIDKRELGITLIATFGTAGTKSVIQSACRGYRSEEYPDGISIDEATYISSLVPKERGFNYTIGDLIHGNKEKDRKPVQAFINEVSQYPNLLEIMQELEGLIVQRGSHASGVIMFGEDPYEFGSFMKTPGGEIITQYDLHTCEDCGMTKYDFLTTEVLDKLGEFLKLVAKDKLIDEGTIRQMYDAILHPDIVNTKNPKIWEALSEGKVIDCFQFSDGMGLQTAKKLKCKNVMEMTEASALMRLMAPEGEEAPIDKYCRFKKDIMLWYQELVEYKLTPEEIKTVEPYFKKSYGCPPLQEQFMLILMDKNIAHFSLKEANAARRIVGKKLMDKIPSLKKQIFDYMGGKEKLFKYVWDCGIKPQLGYAFSKNHSLPYSYIGVQTLVAAVEYNPIYWNTACLIVNSGSLEDKIESYIDYQGHKKKVKSTDYGKIAKAIGKIQKDIKVSCVDINKSDLKFSPDVAHDQILYGMKGLNGIGDEVIKFIISRRPYTSFEDFLEKTQLTPKTVVPLIKSGAFDNICRLDRVHLLMEYSKTLVPMGKELTMATLPQLLEKGVFKQEEFPESIAVWKFHQYLNKNCKCKIQLPDDDKPKDYYKLNQMAINTFDINYDIDALTLYNNNYYIRQKTKSGWEGLFYNPAIKPIKDAMQNDKENILNRMWKMSVNEMYLKLSKGTNNISAWEMQCMSFYQHDHILKSVDQEYYGLSNFFDLPETPQPVKFFKKGKKSIPLYEIEKICGTVVDKNNDKHIVTILTTEGVVDCKFSNEFYAMFNKQVSEEVIQKNGKTKNEVKEKGWFTKGNVIIVSGIRDGDVFRGKVYKKSNMHQLYKVEKIKSNGELLITSHRYGEEIDQYETW